MCPICDPIALAIMARSTGVVGVVIRAAKLASRSYCHTVFLIARGADGRLARSATVELGLDVGLGEGQTWRAVLDDARNGFAV